KKNDEILYQHEKKLKGYDPALRLDMPDLLREIQYYHYSKHKWHNVSKASVSALNHHAAAFCVHLNISFNT
uniref:hypothetical protein n=1 Tax=Candidatus Williamhamiltonella defendens TaxID=138072 RepID=UPI001C9DD95E